MVFVCNAVVVGVFGIGPGGGVFDGNESRIAWLMYRFGVMSARVRSQ